MSTHNIGFYEKWQKLSLNYHQISSILALSVLLLTVCYLLSISDEVMYTN